MQKASLEKRLIQLISLGLIAFVVIYAVTFEEEGSQTTEAPVETANAVAISANPLANIPFKGSKNAKVVIIESSDFQ